MNRRNSMLFIHSVGESSSEIALLERYDYNVFVTDYDRADEFLNNDIDLVIITINSDNYQKRFP